MQDINQQLYERKDTPEGFIPVYGVVVTVSDDIYILMEKKNLLVIKLLMK